MSRKAELRRAGAEEVGLFYSWMEKQFHKDELKSLARIRTLLKMGVYDVFGLWREEELIAYALLGKTEDERCWLLDYYAVLPEHQGQGWGSLFLNRLCEMLPGDALMLEVEDPDYSADAEDEAHRRRRIGFYEQNGCVDAGIRIELFGLDYAIYQRPMKKRLPDRREARAAMDALYKALVPLWLHAQNVRFRED